MVQSVIYAFTNIQYIVIPFINPKLIVVLFYFLQTNLTHLSRSEFVMGIGLGIAKCPYDPLDNSTAIYVEDGNPGGLPGLVSNYHIYVTRSNPISFLILC